MEEAAAKKKVADEQRRHLMAQSESDEDMEMWQAFAQFNEKENEIMDDSWWS